MLSIPFAFKSTGPCAISRCQFQSRSLGRRLLSKLPRTAHLDRKYRYLPSYGNLILETCSVMSWHYVQAVRVSWYFYDKYSLIFYVGLFLFRRCQSSSLRPRTHGRLHSHAHCRTCVGSNSCCYYLRAHRVLVRSAHRLHQALPRSVHEFVRHCCLSVSFEQARASVPSCDARPNASCYREHS